MPRPDKLNGFMKATSDLQTIIGKGYFSQPSLEKEPETLNKSSEPPIDMTAYLRKPKYSLNSFIFPTEKSQQQVKKVLADITHHDLIYNTWGMGEKHPTDVALSINCYGPPGTGKSMLLEVMAHNLGLKVLEVPSTASKFVGVTEQIIEEIFSFATTHNAFIVWNEADRDFGKRLEQVSQSADVGVNSARSILLDRLSSYQGVIGLTTNLLHNYDPAFISRIRFEIQLDLPDVEARAKIWQAQIPSKLPLDESVNFSQLAAQFDEISGRDIKKAVLNAVTTAASEGKPDSEKCVAQSHFIQAMEEVIAGKKAAEKEELKLTPVTGNVELPPQPSIESKPPASEA
ncbi:ATP-binding protein [Aerosakkonema funiforme]|uniref:ATP-binding protein n=1 Tax=Aerosakkonema funiforme TaxID=1246630 RepID=UPI0035B95BA4